MFAQTRYMVALLCCVIFLGCSLQRKAGEHIARRAVATKREVVRAMLDYNIAKALPFDQTGYEFKHVFVRVEGSDPDPVVLQGIELPAGGKTVLPASISITSEAGVFHRTTKQRGLLIEYQAIRIQTSRRAEIDVVYFISGLSGSVVTYRLELSAHQWVVAASRIKHAF
jgi:hypothetical protein